MKKIISIIFIFIQYQVYSQNNQQTTSQNYENTSTPMADSFREEGKIYVVITIILIILVGIFLYLISIDRKIKYLEQQQKTK